MSLDRTSPILCVIHASYLPSPSLVFIFTFPLLSNKVVSELKARSYGVLALVVAVIVARWWKKSMVYEVLLMCKKIEERKKY
ncbi:hypothetical protein RchiOBHm_Chr6g0285271 [Rosa chinensis]|uniref:Transmembrane protein n=1 Tax=Rosa chinensis TaxID=74649 RepID=A0A2P6PUH5_ROSCH|nr:hypothetical protein RchiOBHm_Chr6g0285271 [Rosa chinensis]